MDSGVAALIGLGVGGAIALGSFWAGFFARKWFK